MWSPDPTTTTQLVSVFAGLLSRDNHVRQQANDALASIKLQPHYENYLFHILLDNSAPLDVRAGAGVQLKNAVKKSLGDRSFLLDNILQGLLVDDHLVRNITGNIVASLFSTYGLQWKNVLDNLTTLAQDSSSTPPATQIAAMSTLAKICEDSPYELTQPPSPPPVIPVLLHFMTHPQAQIRAHAINALCQFVPLQTQAFLVHLDEFLDKLFVLAHDESPGVQKNMCTAFSLILESRPDKLAPHLEGVLAYCLHLMRGNDDETALEACEFMLALSGSTEDKSVFAPHLADILPVLLARMVYSEEERFLMEMADERDKEDRDEDIRPHTAKGKDTHGYRSDDDDDDDDDDYDELDQWSLRKCAAATLDVLSVAMPREVLHVTLPILQERIVSDEWPVREASILAFGAMAGSCMELAADKLAPLVPFLVERLGDGEPRVRQISCWTLLRYAPWVCGEARAGGACAGYFEPTMQRVVACGLDPVQAVQEAACSALSAFVEETEHAVLVPYVDAMLEHFAACFSRYLRKNMMVLYDCVQTFVEKMGGEVLAVAARMDVLLPPLMQKWSALEDDDVALWPLLECMATVAATLGEAFAPCAVPVYERAVKILSTCIETSRVCVTDPLVTTPEADFLVTALDLIDGLVQGLGEHATELIEQHPANLMGLLMVCFEDYNADVRQSAYALLGDLAIFCLGLLRPYVSLIVVSVGNEIDNRSFNTYPVYNNAIWAVGEMAVRLPYTEMRGYVDSLVLLLVPIVNSSEMQLTVLENAAICLGRLGVCDSRGESSLAPRLVEYIVAWCTQMSMLVENEEKETSFAGMVNIINANPDGGFGGLATAAGRKHLAMFVSCVGGYEGVLESVYGELRALLEGYKGILGGEWHSVLEMVGPDERRRIEERY